MSKADTKTNLTKLIALDQSDLEVISAHCQDAVVRLEDIAYLQEKQRFILLLNRFAWEQADNKTNQRRRSALHFECVKSAKHLNIDLNKKDDVKKLLAVNFHAQEDPSGTISLIFSGGSEIKLAVECIETMLKDLGAIWEASSRPKHAE